MLFSFNFFILILSFSVRQGRPKQKWLKFKTSFSSTRFQLGTKTVGIQKFSVLIKSSRSDYLVQVVDVVINPFIFRLTLNRAKSSQHCLEAKTGQLGVLFGFLNQILNYAASRQQMITMEECFGVLICNSKKQCNFKERNNLT